MNPIMLVRGIVTISTSIAASSAVMNAVKFLVPRSANAVIRVFQAIGTLGVGLAVGKLIEKPVQTAFDETVDAVKSISYEN